MMKFIKNYMSNEQKRLRLIKKDPFNIGRIGNPTQAEQMLAVQLNYLTLGVIEHPETLAVYEAVRLNPAALKLIEDQDEELQKFACSVNPRALKYLPVPYESAVLISLNKMGNLIGLIDNPTPTMQFAAVHSQPEAIRRIKSPDEAVQYYVIEKNYSYLNLIDHPTVGVVIEALNKFQKQNVNSRRIPDSKLLNLKAIKFTEDEWWEVIKAHPGQYEIMNLTPEQISYAQLCS